MPVLPFALSVGARGWLHPGWCGSYYPDDLPRDWQLDFYANEFRQVLVPAGYWAWAGREQVAEWAHQVDDGFRFFVEVPDGERSRFAALLEPLQQRLGGIVLPPGAARPVGLPESVTLFVVSGPAAATPAAWRGAPADLADAPSASLFVLTAAGSHTPRELRRWCEALAPPPAGGEVMLFVDGAPPPVGDLSALKQLSELMT